MERRNFLKALPFAAGAVAAPTAIASAQPAENAWQRADRLAHELADALAQIEVGRWSAHVHGDNRAMNVVFQNDLMPRSATLTPKAKVQAAVDEMRVGMAGLGHDRWLAMIREESTSHGGGFANAMLFDGSGSLTNQIKLGQPHG